MPDADPEFWDHSMLNLADFIRFFAIFSDLINREDRGRNFVLHVFSSVIARKLRGTEGGYEPALFAAPSPLEAVSQLCKFV